MKKIDLIFLVLLGSFITLSTGCGLKGDLYLPTRETKTDIINSAKDKSESDAQVDKNVIDSSNKAEKQ